MQNILDGEFCVEHWESEAIVSTQTMKYLSKVLQGSTQIHPIIHPVNLAVSSRLLASGPKVFSKFWKTVIIGEYRS